VSAEESHLLAIRSDGTPPGTSITLDGVPLLDVVKLEFDIDATRDELITARITLECRLDIETTAKVTTQ
jgi:hypothetical protein